MSGVRIRPASPNDSAPVSALLKTSYSLLLARDYSAEVLDLALPLICKANPALLQSGTYYVAESPDGLIVGCGGWTPQRPGTGDERDGLGHIRHFATHPTWTRQGIGRALVERCKTDARASGISRFECYSSLSARNFYAALDFRACGSIDVRLSDACVFPSVHMECAL
ncbi:GNAT family N-acetyltransferase [Magnetovibrio sp.]|uniref:GNAT family N-acetyltransferase n=1 Tax=Magnetovibrio sp. TaxID=2024836 RepID=UPI002F94E479